MAISVERRELIVEAKKRGGTEKETAMWLGVSTRTVRRVWKQFLTEGHVSPKKSKGRPSRLTQEDVERIAAEVKRSPDSTLAELIDCLSLPIRKSQLHRLLGKLGLTFKKNAPPKKPA
jgi:transposase